MATAKEKAKAEVDAQVEEAKASDTPVDEAALADNVEANTGTGDAEAPAENTEPSADELALARNTTGAVVTVAEGVKFPDDPGVDNSGGEGARDAAVNLVDPELPSQEPTKAHADLNGLEDEVSSRDPRIAAYLEKGYTLADLVLTTDSDGTLSSVTLA